MTLAQTAILALATLRMTWFLMIDAGPWDSMVKLRLALGVGKPGEMGFFDKLVSCPWCVSIWLAPFSIWAVSDWDSARWVLTPLAMSCSVGIGWAILAWLSSTHSEKNA